MKHSIVTFDNTLWPIKVIRKDPTKTVTGKPELKPEEVAKQWDKL